LEYDSQLFRLDDIFEAANCQLETRVDIHIHIYSEIMKLIDGRTPWTRNQPCRKAATYTGQHKHNKSRQTSMPLVGFEPMTPMLERAKTSRALDRVATGIGH
jgi:hypothetical protein